MSKVNDNKSFEKWIITAFSIGELLKKFFEGFLFVHN